MVGVQHDIDVEDARQVAEVAVMTGKMPPPQEWCDGLIEAQDSDAMESFF